MNNFGKKIVSFLMWCFSVAIGFFIFLLLVDLVMKNILLFQQGYINNRFIFLLIPVVALSFPVFLIFSSHYYNNKGSIKRFSLITSLEMYLLAALVIVYRFGYSLTMLGNNIDWMVLVTGLLSGSLSLYLFHTHNSKVR